MKEKKQQKREIWKQKEEGWKNTYEDYDEFKIKYKGKTLTTLEDQYSDEECFVAEAANMIDDDDHALYKIRWFIKDIFLENPSLMDEVESSDRYDWDNDFTVRVVDPNYFE